MISGSNCIRKAARAKVKSSLLIFELPWRDHEHQECKKFGNDNIFPLVHQYMWVELTENNNCELIRFNHGLATKEGCRTEPKSRNLEYAMGVRSTRFMT
jgi:hypothetical protein